MNFKLNRRSMLAATAGTIAGAASAQGSSFPDKPIRIILPAAPGGILDQTGRVLGKALQELLSTPVIIENRAGAGGRIGADVVMKASADGYTLLLSTNGTLTYIPAVEKNGAFHPLRDLTPLSEIGAYNLFMVVHPSVPVRTVQEFIAYAKANKGKLNYASTGQASGLHFAGEVFKSMAGVEMTHVAYKGSAPALQDVLANTCQVMFAPAEVLAHVQAGNVRALGATTLQRDPRLPDVPTLAESGLPGYDVGAWIALCGPQRLAKDVQDRLVGAVQKALSRAEVRSQLAALGINVVAGSPSQLELQMRTETAKLREIAARLNIAAET